MMASLLERGMAFADCAVQVHAGDAIAPSTAAWHFDAPNSALHLAVAIRGRRSLLLRAAAAADAATGSEAAQEHAHPQAPGDAYLSSPFAIEHAVTYGAAPTWGERVVAMQLRIQTTGEELECLCRDRDAWPAMQACITPAIEALGLRLPGYAAVLAVADGLEAAPLDAVATAGTDTHSVTVAPAATAADPAARDVRLTKEE